MKKRILKMLSILCALGLTIGAGTTVKADRIDEEKGSSKPYLSLGSDLTQEEKKTVLNLFGLSEKDLEDYDVGTVTNAEEHEYLGEYLDDSVIGTKALSSVKVVGKNKGNGVQVTTQNITFCTTGMYRNAMITAGIKDADITVVGPYKISGTAALVGVSKAYESMTGEKISEKNLDVANEELVTTGDLANKVGDTQKVEELIALMKKEVVENDLKTEEDFANLVEKATKELDISLSQEDKDKLESLMKEVGKLDLDVDTIKSQAQDLYDKLDKLDFQIDKESIGNFFTRIIDAIVEFFKNLFGK